MSDSWMNRVQGVLEPESLVAVVPSVACKEGQGVSGAKSCSDSCLPVQREAAYFSEIGHRQGCSTFALNDEKYLGLVECLLYSRFYSTHFTCIHSFNPYDSLWVKQFSHA